MITLQEKLLNDITNFRERHKMSIRQFGMLTVRCHKVIPKISRGAILLKTADRLYEFMKEYDEKNSHLNSN